MKTTARLTAESFRFDQPVQTHLVVSLLAPPLEQQAKRPPVCVIPVIDISGSMAGPKLHQARQSVMKLIDHLGPQDRCGVVVFSSGVEVVSPPVEMASAAKAQLKLKVGELRVHGNTNLSGGMLAGLELGNLASLPEGMLVRVILFTDGQANAARAMSEKVRDAESFEGSASHRKSMQAGLKRGSSSSLEGEAKMRLHQMGKKFSTKAQEDMDDSVGKPPARPDPGTPPAPRGVNRKRSRRW